MLTRRGTMMRIRRRMRRRTTTRRGTIRRIRRRTATRMRRMRRLIVIMTKVIAIGRPCSRLKRVDPTSLSARSICVKFVFVWPYRNYSILLSLTAEMVLVFEFHYFRTFTPPPICSTRMLHPLNMKF